ncbi:MAG TPA: FAD-dependent oxidoreductase, partial [Vicinamibacterales bacterium]|nr:FAD-dependent oxidoreductase [Vicinamibacterales bacterium]
MNITVVGAGVVGCAVAYELASRGAHVELVDPRGPGRGATAASAGILAPLIEGHSTALLRLGTCSVALWDDFIRRIQSDSGQSVEYARSGTLHVALNDAQAGELSTVARRFKSANVPHTVL